MKYAIIENEPFSLKSLQQTIAALRPDYELTFTAESVEESIAFFMRNPAVDIIFMDIELVDGNCFEIFSKVEVRTPIVFTTAYDTFALQAFKVNSVDYLLKPIHETDLEHALQKHERSRKTEDEKRNLALSYGKLAQAGTKHRILTVSGDSYSFVEIADVAFFVSEDKCIFAYRKNGGRRLTALTALNNLSEVEAVVNPNDFFKLSRDLVVNISAIASVHKFFHGRLSVVVGTGSEERKVVVSTARRKEFLDWLGGQS